MLLSCRWPRPEPQHGLAALTALGPLPATAGQGSGGGEAAERPNHAVQRRAPRRAARTVRRSPHRRGCAYPARPAPRAADPGDSPTPGFPGPVSPVPCPESRGRGGGGRAPPRGVSGHLMARAPPPRRSPSARGSRGALEQSRGRARHGRAGQGRAGRLRAAAPRAAILAVGSGRAGAGPECCGAGGAWRGHPGKAPGSSPHCQRPETRSLRKGARFHVFGPGCPALRSAKAQPGCSRASARLQCPR